ncbi:tyrosine-type recombinase/integrase [Neptunicella sp.]|uniref:tyrosine-type recombinase/integrase n=1 Tax=Neptunicella sp. TaxID=2125986 RepID=UPI003F691CBB
MALTDTKLRSLLGKQRAAVIELPDRDGLVVSCGKSGKLSWVFRYRYGGGSRRIVLGSYPAFSLIDAREKAVNCRKLLETGVDPKLPAESDPTEILSLNLCARAWLDNYVVNLRAVTNTKNTAVAIKYFTDARFKYDVRTARFEEWIAYFDAIAADSSRVNAGNVLKNTKSMLRWCKQRGMLNHSRVFDIDLRAVGDLPAVGQRTLDLYEVAGVWRETERSKATPAIKACVKLLILTGARNSEIRLATFSEFDLVRKIWTLPASRSKTGKIIRRAISDDVVSIINSLALIYGGDGFLIPGAHRGTAMTIHSVNRFVQRVWGKLHSANNMVRFTPHDFRRTLSTRLSEKGVLPHVTEKMLGHELQGVMKIYNKHDWIDEQRKAYELWCDLIEQSIVNVN